MILTRKFVLGATISLMLAFPAVASGDPQTDLSQEPARSTDRTQQLARELSLARRSNSVDRVRQLENDLWSTMPAAPVEGQISAPSENETATQRTSGQLRWGDDIQLYAGALMQYDQYPVAMVADTLGAIYVAVNAVFRDTSSRIIVYRSSDHGTSWTALNSFFASSGRPIHSFDMCVTDTAGGNFLLGIAFVVQYNDSYYAGGKLYWASMLSNGAGLRISVIANADSAHLYGNPSICTDGDKFAPSSTYHYIAAEVGGITATTYPWQGLYITHTTNWGKSWVYPDTSITGTLVETPDIIVDYTTLPESLCVAYHHQGTTTHHLSVARNSIARTAAWESTPIVRPSTMSYPRLAIDPVRGNAILTYGHYSSAIEYLYSSDLFKSYTRDSIAAGSNSDPVAISWSPSGAGYMWRVAYRSHYAGGTVSIKAIQNHLTGFYQSTPLAVNQYKCYSGPAFVVGQTRDLSSGAYRTCCAYVGEDKQNVYFDAGDLTVDVPLQHEGLPSSCALEQNYPNPFNPKTVVSCRLSVASNVKLAVYDLLGREVEVLIDEYEAPGTYSATWDATGMPSGVYFFRLMAGDARETKKMTLLR